MSIDSTICTGNPIKVRQDATLKHPLVPPTSQQQANNTVAGHITPPTQIRVTSHSRGVGDTAKQVISGPAVAQQAVQRTTPFVTGRLNSKPTPPPKPKFTHNTRGK